MPHRRWLRILPVAFVMYTIAFTNRVNISLALPSMIRDLHMDPMQAGSAAGVFFWGYLVLQIPGGHLARRWSAKHFVSILLLTWGICSVGCGLVQTGQQLSVMRFLLGLAQGGVWPATLVLLSNWFPRAERARANTFWMLCLPAAMVLSLPLSGWILDQWGWRVMLIAEGALPLVWLPVWMKFIDDDPHRARWISSEEREYLDTTLRREYAELETVNPKPSLRYLLHPQVLVMAFLLFLDAGGFYGYLFWLPSILGSTKTSSNLLIGILSAVPFLIAGMAMVLYSQHSDKTGERRNHVGIAFAVAGVLLLASVLLGRSSPVLSFVLICLAGAAALASAGPFWAIPTETLPRGVVGSAMGLINAVGNIGGYFGPLVVGYLNERTGNIFYSYGSMSVAWAGAGALAFLLRPVRAPAKKSGGEN